MDRLERARELRRIIEKMTRAQEAVPLVPPEIFELASPGPRIGGGRDGDTRYYLVLEGESVFRVRWEHGGLWPERMTPDGGWIDDIRVLDYFLGFEFGAHEIDEREARRMQREIEAEFRVRRGSE